MGADAGKITLPSHKNIMSVDKNDEMTKYMNKEVIKAVINDAIERHNSMDGGDIEPMNSGATAPLNLKRFQERQEEIGGGGGGGRKGKSDDQIIHSGVKVINPDL